MQIPLRSICTGYLQRSVKDDKSRSPIVPGQIEGFLSGCPFCTSRRIGIPEIGARFQIISGLFSGSAGTVVEWPGDFPRIENEFLAQLDHEPPNVQTRISIERQSIQALPALPTPEWAPPVCSDEADKLDKAVVTFCEKSHSGRKWKIDWHAFNGVVYTIWYYRLPLTSSEVWRILEAHGATVRSKKRLVEFFEKARSLLVYSCGRKPIKKKRVAPLSIRNEKENHRTTPCTR